MSRFGIGQIVAVNGTNILPGDGCPPWRRAGDRGTIVAVRENGSGQLEAKVLWHPGGSYTWMIERWLCRYTDPTTNTPGRSQGAGNTVRALAKVIDTELPHALEEVTRDLERARMTAEDFRCAARSAEITLSQLFALALS